MLEPWSIEVNDYTPTGSVGVRFHPNFRFKLLKAFINKHLMFLNLPARDTLVDPIF